MLLKRARIFVLVFLFLLLTSQEVLAASPYVLPYPGLMPGNKLYKVKQVFDQLYRFWVFGDFAGHQYELKLADRKLVEAKILFEYQQYLLGVKALTDSNQHFQRAVDYLKAEKEGKDISQKRTNLENAAQKHQEILEGLSQILPKEFLWQPEKKEATKLKIESAIKEAIGIREI